MGDVHMARTACPKCGSEMERGHMPDATSGGIVQERWTPGDAEEIRFLGMSAGIRSKAKESIPVTAFRCAKCGFLEMYAVKP